MVPGKRYTVFSIRKKSDNAPVIWVRAGVAFVNPDDSMNLYLDVLPMDGQLHIREAAEKRATPITGKTSHRPVAVPNQPTHQTQQPTQVSEAQGNDTDTDRPESWAAQQSLGGH